MRVTKAFSAGFFIAVACILLSAAAFAQESQGKPALGQSGDVTATSGLASAPESVFAPFPSKLRAAVRGNEIVLTWIDSTDVRGSYIVYRSTKPINAENLESAVKLAVVDPGIQTYIDRPGDTTPYYYLVLALAEDGSPYPVFIPAKNATAVAIGIEQSALAAAPPAPPAAPVATAPVAVPATSKEQKTQPIQVKESAPARPTEPFADKLSASVKGEALILSYTAPAGARLVLYRGTSPIRGASDLLNATLVSAFANKDGSFADYPVPGVQYYYALLGEEDIKAGVVALFPGRNTLEEPVGLKAFGTYSGFTEVSPSSRTPPLPYLIPDSPAAIRGQTLPRDEAPSERSIAPDTKKAIDILLANASAAQTTLPELSFHPEELSTPSGGEDYTLAVIMKETLASQDWQGAVDQLRKYLSLNRGVKAAARAHFYLGQALTYTGTYRDAFFEFLLARELYPSDTKHWIEYVLAKLKSTG
jgi:hypothetical protein